jgi:hypothetical protein
MKRTLPTISKTSKRSAVALDAKRLTAVRGGTGIAVDVVSPTPSIMQLQHNETLIQL